MTDVSDELLKIIVEGSGRTYTHEAKAMAAEIIRWRAKAKAATPQSGTATSTAGTPWGLLPP